MQHLDARAALDTARLLLRHDWLTHADERCRSVQADVADLRDEQAEVLQAIAARRADGARDLSRDHKPVLVLRDTGTIISTLHFTHLDDPHLKREAFRQAVHYIDVETSSQCNRKCLYCPNSQNDRFSDNNFMDRSTYESLIGDLSAIDYGNTLQFVGYSEPLLHMDDLEGRVRTARRHLPKAHLTVYTNGDFIETAVVDRLIAAGATEIKISVHLPVGQPYSDEAIFKRIRKIAKRLGTAVTPTDYAPNRHIAARLDHPGIVLTIYQVDYQQFGSNRGSTLENVGPAIAGRTAACHMPFYQFIVGHRGAVVPCCVMVSDDPRNARFLMGAVPRHESIFDLYTNARFVQWRRGLFNLQPKSGPCAKCAWDVEAPILNAPGLYDAWRHLTGAERSLALAG